MSSGISRDRLMSRNELSAKLNSWIPIFIYCAEKSTAICLQTLPNRFCLIILEKRCWLRCLVILHKYAAEGGNIARCKAVLKRYIYTYSHLSSDRRECYLRILNRGCWQTHENVETRLSMHPVLTMWVSSFITCWITRMLIYMGIWSFIPT